MTPADTLSLFFSSLTLFGIVKAMFIAGLVLYLAFAVIIIRQVQIMNETLDDTYNTLVTVFAWVHLVLTVLLLMLSFIFL